MIDRISERLEELRDAETELRSKFDDILVDIRQCIADDEEERKLTNTPIVLVFASMAILSDLKAVLDQVYEERVCIISAWADKRRALAQELQVGYTYPDTGTAEDDRSEQERRQPSPAGEHF